MCTLTTKQQADLVVLVNESFGPDLESEEFTDRLLGLFEDIPGFETMPTRGARRLIDQLWRSYRGKKA